MIKSREELEQRLKTHDWYYMMSDDSRVFHWGDRDLKEIRKALKEICSEEEAEKLFFKYAPNNLYKK